MMKKFIFPALIISIALGAAVYAQSPGEYGPGWGSGWVMAWAGAKAWDLE